VIAAVVALPLALLASGLCEAVAVLPYPVVVPYSNVTVVLAPLLLTVPLSVAPVVDRLLAASVVAVGTHALVVNVSLLP
jgi:hypothetical protein